MNEFFDKYDGILEQHKFTVAKVYNVDETALSTVHKPSKVIAQKGKHQVSALTSGERGLTTACGQTTTRQTEKRSSTQHIVGMLEK